MSRFATYGKRDTPLMTDGDLGFRGINMLLDRGLLEPGYLARGENTRMRDRVVTPRGGASAPADFNPPFSNAILGSAIYSSPNGDEVLLVAEANASFIWALEFNKDPVQINLASGQNNGPVGFVNFVQGFEKVIMLRYPYPILPQGPQLVWDGDNTHTFDPIALSPGGIALVPQTITGTPFQNRILYYDPYYPLVPRRDQFIMSDVLDYTSYDPVFSVFRINAGESDILTSVFPYFKGAVIVFMQNSTHLLENFTVDATLASQRLLSDRIGSTGYLGPVQVGRDVMFLSKSGGIFRVSEIIQDQIAAQPVPVSRPIQPLIDQLDYDRANLYFSSVAVDDYVYFAMTRMGYSGAADCLAVYNSVTSEWESAPDWFDDPNFRINRLHVALYGATSPGWGAGRPRVFAIDYNAPLRGMPAVYMLNDGLEDQINNDSIPVKRIMETRGYTAGDPASFKRFQRASLGIRSYGPNATVTAISDGYNEEKVVANITKSRTKFYTQGTPDFDPNTGDPTAPKREDYSVSNLDNTAVEDFEGLPEGDISVIPASSPPIAGPKQQSLERFMVRQNGRWVSFRVEDTTGQCDVLGIQVEAIPIGETARVIA